MKTFFTIIIAFIIMASLYPQTYKKIEIQLNSNEDIERLNQSGIDLEGAINLKKMTASIFADDAQLATINKLGFNYRVVIDDWIKYYNNLPKLSTPEINQSIEQSKSLFGVTGFGYGSMGGFYTYDEVNAQLDTMYAHFPGLITAKQSIGTTAGGRPIYMVRISNSSLTQPKPQASYLGMHHAREPMGMECLIYFMYYLLENYNTNSSVKYLVDNRELFFVPICNPDGYEYNRSTNPSGGGLWRKNRKDNGDGTYGIDINRNYGPDIYWNAPNGGSSTSTSSDTYRGTAPFSENETAAIKNYYAAHRFKNSISYHTYGNDMIYPYGALNKETPDSIYFREYARDMTSYNGYVSGTDMQTVGYHTRGSSDDYFYDGDTIMNGGKIFAMTPEVGSNFWTAQGEIMPDVQINLLPNLYWAWIAGDYVTLKNANFDRLYFKPGDTASLKPTFRNKGLSNSTSQTIEVNSLSNYCTVLNSSQMLDSIASRSDNTVANPIKFAISSSAPVSQKISLSIANKVNGTVMSLDTISFTIGIPTFIFQDTATSISTFWNVAGTPSTAPVWSITTADYHSAPSCYTDSKSGNYAANETVTMTSSSPINLSGFSNPKLSFWTKWNIETQYDCGIVQISTDNGTTWNALKGNFTKAASGLGKQVPAGIPIYDGSHPNWSQEIADLSSYSGQQIKFRFMLSTDGGVNVDGWYIDDINVYYYGALPVELNSLTAKSGINVVTISWKTATELNNQGFEIERSKDLNSRPGGWHKIGFVKGNGTSTSKLSYSFIDANPLAGKQYYRIKQIDMNGTYTSYGPVEADNFEKLEFALEQNYPNPFNPSTIIKYQIPFAGNVTLKVYDMLGNEVANLVNDYKKEGSYQVNFNKSKFASGIYTYQLRVNDNVLTKKMILLK